MSSMIENLDSLARLLLEALLNTLWQGMLIAFLAWLLLRLVSGLSATTRHAVWFVTLLTIGALPLIAVVANRSEPAADSSPNAVLHLAAFRMPEAPPLVAQSATPSPATGLESEESDSPSPSQPSRRMEMESVIAGLSATEDQWKISVDIDPPPQIQERNAVAAPVLPKAEIKSFRERVKSMLSSALSGQAPLALVGLWAALWALMSWRVARSYRAVFRLRRRLKPTPSEHNGRVERLASLFGIKRPVRAFTSGQVVMPMTIGSLKPVIILPDELADELSQPEFESVVAHELAHIKRWDYLTNMLQRIVQSYLFFHPAVWFICKQLTIEREMACDDWAVKTCEPRRYASCLTKLVEALNESKTHMAVRVAATGIGGIVFGKHVISRRVEMILNRDRNATTAVSKPAMLYAIGLVVMFVAVCSLISPVIAVPLGQKTAKQAGKDGKAAAPAKSPEIPPAPPAPQVQPPPDAMDLVAAPNVPNVEDVPDVPDIPDAPLAPVAVLPPAAPEAPLRGVAVVGIPGGVRGGIAVQPAFPDQGGQASSIAPLPPQPPLPAVVWAGPEQEKRAEPAIPEGELISLLVDIVKRDADPNVRNEALQGLYRIRTDAGINALIQLYDGTSDVKIKGEIIRYLLRREGRDGKVDNSKAIAKLTAIAKSEQNEELRNLAIRYLGHVKGDEGANILIQIYDSLQNQKMKQYVIRSLASNGSRKAVDKLVQIAKNDSDPVVRQYAIRSIYNVDNKRYLELDRSRIGMVDGKFFIPKSFTFNLNGEAFKFDAKKWEEWQKNWRKNWEEQQEKIREMIEDLRLDEKLKIEDLQNKLRIEIPKIDIQLKELEDKIKLGYGFNNISAVENQLGLQLANVEAQLAAMRAKHSDEHLKTVKARVLRDALERQLNSVRSMRKAAARAGAIQRATSSQAPVSAPRVKATTIAATS
ncbi:MAG TPA: M56 family metallopeptidase, partial [Blastocatellia bacterium]